MARFGLHRVLAASGTAAALLIGALGAVPAYAAPNAGRFQYVSPQPGSSRVSPWIVTARGMRWATGG